jgi:hypothetical protein
MSRKAKATDFARAQKERGCLLIVWGDFADVAASSAAFHHRVISARDTPYHSLKSPLSWLIKVELVVEAGQIRAVLLDNAFRDWRKLRSGERSAARVFCPSIMGVRDNLHVVGMALSVDLEGKFQGHAMNPFRMLHKLRKHHSTSDVSDLICIRSPDGIPVCRVRIGLHRRDH